MIIQLLKTPMGLGLCLYDYVLVICVGVIVGKTAHFCGLSIMWQCIISFLLSGLYGWIKNCVRKKKCSEEEICVNTVKGQWDETE